MEANELRKVQLAQLEIAKEIKRICENNNIHYFLDSGTLLGAVRHKGFIPWDDDMDFGMLRDDYNKFLVKAKEQLKPQFYIQEWKDNLNYPLAFAKIRKKGTLFVEENSQYSSFGKELYVDIFPYDSYPDDLNKRKYQGFCLNFLRRINWAKGRVFPYLSEQDKVKKEKSKRKYLIFSFISLFGSHSFWQRKYDRFATLFNDEESKFVFPQGGASDYGKWVIPRRCFDEFIDLEFEGTLFACPSGYSLYLESVYGDYMQLPPVEKRENRHNIIEYKL